MRILIVIPNLNGGGAQRMALDLAEHLQTLGDAVAVCAAGSTGSFRGEVGALDLYEQDARIRLMSLVSFIRFLRRTVRDYEPDVIVAHLLPLNMLVLALRRFRLLRGPVVIVEHSHLSASERFEAVGAGRRALRRIILRVLYPHAEAVVGVSTEVAHDIASRLKEPSNVIAIPNGIDVQRIRSAAGEITEESVIVAGLTFPVLVAVGRMLPVKGFDTLFDAFAQIRAHDACANASLVILGDGPERAALEAQGRRLGVDGSVHRSPYGAAKVYAYWMARNYRDAYGIYAVNGILFNHESPRRGETFVTRKITMAVARIAAGLQTELHLGNLDARRDWGYAPEYVEGMWRMLQADEPDDYVLATGTSYSVGDFVRFAFEHAGLDWEQYVRFDPRYLRPTEVDDLIGDASRATEQLGWTATTHTPELAALMVDADRLVLDG